MVAMLIDSRSSHNFIDRVAQMLQLQVKATEEVAVKVANGDRLTSHKKYKMVRMTIQGTV
jgi:uncharacterized ubiquitin-like protein YukD